MTSPITPSTWTVILALVVSGAIFGCGGGSGQAPSSPNPSATSTAYGVRRMQAEPRSAVLACKGSLIFTSLGVRTGSQVEEIGLVSSPDDCRFGLEKSGSGSFEFQQGANGNGYRRYTAPAAPGLYHFNIARASDPSLKNRIELKVEQAPPGLAAYLEQREVVVAAGSSVVFTVAESAGVSQTNPPRTYCLAVAEPDGGMIERSDKAWAPLGIYKAPATGGTYHVVLTSPNDSNMTDKASIFVVADK